MRKIYFVLFFMLMVSLLFISAASGSNEEGGTKTDSLKKPVKQQKKNLLAGIHAAVCYSGFRSGQHPDRGEGANNPSDNQILEDLRILSRDAKFRLIRLYDSGENSESILRIITENKLDIKVMLGIWLNAELSNHKNCTWLTQPIPQAELTKNNLSNHLEIQKGIRLANKYPKIVVAINVGNEALNDWNDHKVNPDTVISYVRIVKKAVRQPVTVADMDQYWSARGSILAGEVDFISIHVYPVWEGQDIDKAMSYTIENVEKVRAALPNSKIVITEAGWATVASEFGERASEEKQQLYYTQLMEWSAKQNITTFFFEAFDEDWKGSPEDSLGAEKHWGLFTVDRKPKKAMQQFFNKSNKQPVSGHTTKRKLNNSMK
jgi:exo-beta-1,3-glucanase (GH17 family)